jgi:hypothetical protein
MRIEKRLPRFVDPIGSKNDRSHSLECDTDPVCTYPSDPAVPDHTLPFDHQLKPVWNIGGARNFDRGSFSRDV